MTRFDAAEPTDRRKLYVDSITAHRQRGSPFLTLEADATGIEDGAANDFDTNPEATDDHDSELGSPWIQFADGTINLDCTESELERLKDVLGDFPAFKIDELTRPEEAEGVNVRVSAKADPNRIAQFVDAVFLRVYELPNEFRIWAVEI
ncbi:hypothetical protein [Natrarchaeobius chitinivorans]|uniref:DUF7975 domain-containing protein n=1 Tax=Natrarchaeobius chitinivorans TaxID=1679083 RepID=A0A3N6MQY5_NATCH|nr:hypothetical protein [Natrarchaeobius chitinivorans]RQG97046.1 hypothetical protein EA473_02915 [Natrarchaeobius chitinivorans]